MGVWKRKWGRWVSEIRLPNSRRRIWLRSYNSTEKAGRAFDAAVFCLCGSSAKFNFPSSPPDIPGGDSLTPPEIQAVVARFANLVAAPAPPELYRLASPFAIGFGSKQRPDNRLASETGGDLSLDASFLDASRSSPTISTGCNSYPWKVTNSATG